MLDRFIPEHPPTPTRPTRSCWPGSAWPPSAWRRCRRCCRCTTPRLGRGRRAARPLRRRAVQRPGAAGVGRDCRAALASTPATPGSTSRRWTPSLPSCFLRQRRAGGRRRARRPIGWMRGRRRLVPPLPARTLVRDAPALAIASPERAGCSPVPIRSATTRSTATRWCPAHREADPVAGRVRSLVVRAAERACAGVPPTRARPPSPEARPQAARKRLISRATRPGCFVHDPVRRVVGTCTRRRSAPTRPGCRAATASAPCRVRPRSRAWARAPSPPGGIGSARSAVVAAAAQRRRSVVVSRPPQAGAPDGAEGSARSSVSQPVPPDPSARSAAHGRPAARSSAASSRQKKFMYAAGRPLRRRVQQFAQERRRVRRADDHQPPELVRAQRGSPTPPRRPSRARPARATAPGSRPAARWQCARPAP